MPVSWRTRLRRGAARPRDAVQRQRNRRDREHLQHEQTAPAKRPHERRRDGQQRRAVHEQVIEIALDRAVKAGEQAGGNLREDSAVDADPKDIVAPRTEIDEAVRGEQCGRARAFRRTSRASRRGGTPGVAAERGGMTAASDLAEGLALEARILQAIDAWARDGVVLAEPEFERLALDLFAFSVRHNAPYRAFAAAAGYDERRPPAKWRELPAVPSAAFKDATLATFDPARAELEFHTSGTTSTHAGKHFMETATLYEAALLATFDRFVLAGAPRLRFLHLVPDPRVAKHSSLGYMLGCIERERGDGAQRFFLHGDALDLDGFARELQAAAHDGAAVGLSGTAFAFVMALDAFERSGARFPLPDGSRILETGGFKGRASGAIQTQPDCYARLSAVFGIPGERIIAEYGMIELTSQYYDTPASRREAVRIKGGPPWLRALVVDPAGREVPNGETGFLRHVDLANRFSVPAIQTEDRGYVNGEGFVLLGRELDAPLRGCSLDAEDLRLRERT